MNEPAAEKSQLQSKLLTLVEKVDSTPNQKLLLYRAGICPRLLLVLGISDFFITWITKHFETTATHSSRSGLALPDQLIRVDSMSQGRMKGLNLPNITSFTTLYRMAKISIACQLLTSCDPITRHVSKSSIVREEAQKRVYIFQPLQGS